MPNTDLRVAMTMGEVEALTSIVFALIATHHDLELLRAHFELSRQATLANLESQAIPESVLDGFHAMNGRLRKCLDHPPEL